MGLITKYAASLYAGGSESNLQCHAIINCYNDTQTTPVMTAYFYHEGYFIPPNSRHVDRVHLRYPISEYDHFLDLLRGMKNPCSSITMSTPKWATSDQGRNPFSNWNWSLRIGESTI